MPWKGAAVEVPRIRHCTAAPCRSMTIGSRWSRVGQRGEQPAEERRTSPGPRSADGTMSSTPSACQCAPWRRVAVGDGLEVRPRPPSRWRSGRSGSPRLLAAWSRARPCGGQPTGGAWASSPTSAPTASAPPSSAARTIRLPTITPSARSPPRAPGRRSRCRSPRPPAARWPPRCARPVAGSPGGSSPTLAGGAGERDRVDESPRVGADRRRTRSAVRRRGHQRHQREALGVARARAPRPPRRGQVGHDQPAGAGLRAARSTYVLRPARRAPCWRTPSARRAAARRACSQTPQHVVRRGTPRAAPGGRGVDHRAVRQRVRERHAQLDQVRARRRRRRHSAPRTLEVRVAAHQVGHQRGAPAVRRRRPRPSGRRPSGRSRSLPRQAPRPGPCRPRPESTSTSSARRRVGHQPGQRVRGLERGDDALQLAPALRKAATASSSSTAVVGHAALVAQPGVLGAGRRGSPGPPRPSAPPGSGRPRPAAPRTAPRAAHRARPWSAAPSGGRCPGRRRRPPRRSAPRPRRPRRATNAPIAFEPPPTQAITRSGSTPASAWSCARASSPIVRCRSRTSAG